MVISDGSIHPRRSRRTGIDGVSAAPYGPPPLEGLQTKSIPSTDENASKQANESRFGSDETDAALAPGSGA
jgi:hypothetical protein